jgi:hypothetical protein
MYASLPQNQKDSSQEPGEEVPRYSNLTLTISDFLHDWCRGLPVVVTNVLLQGRWDPQHFIDHYGSYPVTIINCETGETDNVKVEEYFQRYLHPAEYTGVWKLKVFLF